LSDLALSSAGVTRQDAVRTLDGLTGQELVNAETGIKAQINAKQRDKIVSGAALQKSGRNGFTAEQHFAVAGCIGKVWKHATLAGVSGDRAGDVNITSIKRFTAPILLDNEPATAYVTAKESVEHGHRVYSLELRKPLAGKMKLPVVSRQHTQW